MCGHNSVCVLLRVNVCVCQFNLMPAVLTTLPYTPSSLRIVAAKVSGDPGVAAMPEASSVLVLGRQDIRQAEQQSFDLLINATPVGMVPNVDQSPLERIPAEVVFDMVYNPLETELIRRARALGKSVVPGDRMFIEQAIRQFEIWTGQPAPRAAMEAAALDALTLKYAEQKK